MIGICGWNALKTTQYPNIDNEEKGTVSIVCTVQYNYLLETCTSNVFIHQIFVSTLSKYVDHHIMNTYMLMTPIKYT